MYISERDNRELHHSAVLLLVIACHLILLQLSWLRPTKRTVAGYDSTLVLLPVIPATRPAPANTSTARKTATRVRQKPTMSLAEQRTKSETDAPPSSEELPASAAPMIDWRVAAETVARQAARASIAKPTMRSFGASSSSSNADPAVPGVFTEPKHRFGETSTMINGDSVLWLSEHCYQVLNSEESRFIAFSLGMPDTSHGATRCVYPIGKAKANGELFKHLKPKAPQ